jgi:hypothetical protein
MRLKTTVATIVGMLALTAGPAAPAIAMQEGSPPHGQGKGKGHSTSHGSSNDAKAYGRYCKGESKKHVKGERGTAFSRCVTNMAQAADHKGMAPGQVCKGESKKHEKGEKGTAFSRCVKNVNQLRHQERKEEQQKKKEERQEEHAEEGGSEAGEA